MLKVETVKILHREGLIFTSYQFPSRGGNVCKSFRYSNRSFFSQLSLGWFQLHFLRFPSRCQCYQIVLQQGDALFLPSQWIHFCHTSVDSLACACNFIMDTHLYERAQASNKEQDVPLARRYLFPNFPCLVVLQLNTDWANKSRASPTRKPAMRDRPQIVKAHERQTGAEFPLDRPWAAFMYRSAASVSDLHWGVMEGWLRCWGEATESR